jgi:membrane associated rhomboid family serine protease
VTEDYATCAFHPDRRAGVVCQRCDTPICPSCMTQASVGFHCPNCVKKGKQKVVRGPAAFGATQRPVLTYAIIAVNVAVFLYELSEGDVAGRSSIFKVLVDYGLNGPAIAQDHEWYRLITSAFLHVSIFHIALNMLALWNIGPLLERTLGRTRFGVIYAVSLVAGSAGAVLLAPNQLTAGASGAIYGLIGALIVVFRNRGISFWQSGLGLTLLLNLVFTLTFPNISIGGHLGGLVGGLVATWLFVEGARRLRQPQTVLWVCIALVPLFFVLGLAAANSA